MEKRDILIIVAIAVVLMTILVTGALRSQSDQKTEKYKDNIEVLEQDINKFE